MRMSFVYLIGCDAGGPVKIGHARDLRVRLNSLQVGCWEELKVLHSVSVPCTIAPAAEAAMHTRYWEKRVRGEWFAVPLEVLKISLDSSAHTFTTTRSESDHFSREACISLCKHPQRTMEVLSAYRHRANDAAYRAFIKQVNARLYQEAGAAAYVMFKMVFVEHRDMTTRFENQSRLARQAEASLVKALDVLTAFWGCAQAGWMAVDIPRKIAA